MIIRNVALACGLVKSLNVYFHTRMITILHYKHPKCDQTDRSQWKRTVITADTSRLPPTILQSSRLNWKRVSPPLITTPQRPFRNYDRSAVGTSSARRSAPAGHSAGGPCGPRGGGWEREGGGTSCPGSAHYEMEPEISALPGPFSAA